MRYLKTDEQGKRWFIQCGKVYLETIRRGEPRYTPAENVGKSAVQLDRELRAKLGVR